MKCPASALAASNIRNLPAGMARYQCGGAADSQWSTKLSPEWESGPAVPRGASDKPAAACLIWIPCGEPDE